MGLPHGAAGSWLPSSSGYHTNNYQLSLWVDEIPQPPVCYNTGNELQSRSTLVYVAHDFELKSMELRRLLKFWPDYNDEVVWRPQTWVEFMNIAAKEALRQATARLLDDSLRGWVIRGEIDKNAVTPKDIDLRLWQGFKIET